jgi:hypothetical protein
MEYIWWFSSTMAKRWEVLFSPCWIEVSLPIWIHRGKGTVYNHGSTLICRVSLNSEEGLFWPGSIWYFFLIWSLMKNVSREGSSKRWTVLNEDIDEIIKNLYEGCINHNKNHGDILQHLLQQERRPLFDYGWLFLRWLFLSTPVTSYRYC